MSNWTAFTLTGKLSKIGSLRGPVRPLLFNIYINVYADDTCTTEYASDVPL